MWLCLVVLLWMECLNRNLAHCCTDDVVVVDVTVVAHHDDSVSNHHHYSLLDAAADAADVNSEMIYSNKREDQQVEQEVQHHIDNGLV